MPGSESEAHLRLKTLALNWARERKFTVFAPEVRLPNSNYRADLVAYRPGKKRLESVKVLGTRQTKNRRTHQIGETAIFECKQARSDFLKDSQAAEKTRKELNLLLERRKTLDRLLKVHYPDLARSDSLFPEFQTFDLERSQNPSYLKVLKRIQLLQNRLYEKNKFEKMVRYGCGHLFYLVVEEGILSESEVPLHWGLLVRKGSELDLLIPPTHQDIPESTGLELLHRVAQSSSKIWLRNRIIDT